MEEGEEVGDGRADGSSAIGDRQAAISLMHDADGIRFWVLAGTRSMVTSLKVCNLKVCM